MEKEGDIEQTSGEDLIDVLSLEVLGPLRRALSLWDAGGCGPGGGDLYAIRDAYILAERHLDAICEVIERDVGNLKIVAPWGESILEDRKCEKAFIRKNVAVTP
jgi:hypothetical protein